MQMLFEDRGEWCNGNGRTQELRWKKKASQQREERYVNSLLIKLLEISIGL